MNQTINYSNNKNYYYFDNLDNYFYSPTFNADMCFGISQSKIEIGSYGLGLKDPNNSTTFLEKNISNFLDAKLLETYNKLDVNNKRIFQNFYLNHKNYCKTIYIKKQKQYQYIDDENQCVLTENARFFPRVLDMIKTLPFKSIGRIVVFITEPGQYVQEHRDYPNDVILEKNKEFLWITNKPESKKFYIKDINNNKEYVNEKIIWFNTQQYHGSDINTDYSYSLRIDGKFNYEILDLRNTSF